MALYTPTGRPYGPVYTYREAIWTLELRLPVPIWTLELRLPVPIWPYLAVPVLAVPGRTWTYLDCPGPVSCPFPDPFLDDVGSSTPVRSMHRPDGTLDTDDLHGY